MNINKSFHCSAMELASSPNEFYFEFWQMVAETVNFTEEKTQTTSREKLVVTMTPNQAKSLLAMLDKAVLKYEAAFGSLPVPIDSVDRTACLDKLIGQLFDYLNLKADWDGYGGVAPTEKTVNDAIQFVKTLPQHIPLPEHTVAGSGVVGLYWDDKGTYAEIGFEGDGTFWCYAEDAEGNEAGEDIIRLGDELPSDLLNMLESLAKG